MVGSDNDHGLCQGGELATGSKPGSWSDGKNSPGFGNRVGKVFGNGVGNVEGKDSSSTEETLSIV